MSYVCSYLEFGKNDVRVPGYEQDLILSNIPYAPIPKKLIEPTNDNQWGLVFSYEAGLFYKAIDNVPGTNGALIKSWYSQGGPGPHVLSISAFIIGGDSGEFATPTNFVSFSEPFPPSATSINTDTITHPSVTATILNALPEYEKIDISNKSTSHSIIITTTITKVVFDHFFIFMGQGNVTGNSITAQKSQSCFALAIFKSVKSSSTHEVSTLQWPKIPQIEWPMLISQAINDVITKGNGEIFEHMSAKQLMATDNETSKLAINAISTRIADLEKVKNVITGIQEKRIPK